MTELIKITETNGNKAVSARDLYAFLEVKNHFTQWFDDNKGQFDQNTDYVATKVWLSASNGIGGTNRIDYALTLDCAKEMAMLSKVSKGKQARRYFIECEKQLIKTIAIPKTFSEALQLAADQAKELELAAPKVEYHDKVLSTNNSFTPSQLGSEFGMSAVKFNNHLHTLGVLRKVSGEWILTSKYLGKAYTHRSTFMYSDNKTTHALKWTEKGRKFIYELLK